VAGCADAVRLTEGGYVRFPAVREHLAMPRRQQPIIAWGGCCGRARARLARQPKGQKLQICMAVIGEAPCAVDRVTVGSTGKARQPAQPLLATVLA
jgi:hypothetical protein